MAPNSQLRRLRIRFWWHVGACVLWAAVAAYGLMAYIIPLAIAAGVLFIISALILGRTMTKIEETKGGGS